MFFLALRHLTSRKRQTFLTLMGIVLGSCGYVVVSGFMLGFQEYLIDQLVNNDAHVRVYAREDFLTEHGLDGSFFGQSGPSHVFWAVPPAGRKNSAQIQNPEGWYKRLSADPRVVAYSPQLTTQVIVTRAGASLSGRLVGVEAVRQVRVTNVAEYMTAGKFTDIAGGGNRIMVGEEFLAKLGGRVGDSVLVANGLVAPIPFKIMGSFRTGVKSLDEGTFYSALADVQRINMTPSQVNEIAIRLVDATQAREIARSLGFKVDERVKSWDEINQSFLNVFRIQDMVRYMMVVSILIVAGFGIYNILNMVVSQKRKEIAILRSMGFDSRDILSLFFIQGVILGIVGGLLGLLIGYGICVWLETMPAFSGPMGSSQGHLQVSFSSRIYWYGLSLAFFSSAFASLLPARAAGKMTPIDIIRAGAE